MIEVLRNLLARNHPAGRRKSARRSGVAATNTAVVVGVSLLPIVSLLPSAAFAQGVPTAQPAGTARLSPIQRLLSRAAGTRAVSLAVPGWIVAQVPTGTSQTAAAQMFARAGCTIVGQVPHWPNFFLLSVSGTATRAIGTVAPISAEPVSDAVNTAVAALRGIAGVQADPDYIRQPARQQPVTDSFGISPGIGFIPNDPYFNSIPSTTAPYQRWNLDMINMPAAWAIQSGTRPVYVAIFDTGVDGSNPDLADHLVGAINVGDDQALPDPANPGFIIPDPTAVTDLVGHGTHVAGIVAAEANNGIGVASVAGLDSNGVGTRLYSIRGIGLLGMDLFSEVLGFATIDGMTSPAIDVVNCSFGGAEFSAIEESAIETLVDPGRLPHPIVVVAAAGNDGVSESTYPSDYPNIIRVSAVGTNKQLAVYSSFGDSVAVAAPGGNGDSDGDPTDIWSTWPVAGGADAPTASTYWGISGTSMASPHVAGLAALLIAAGVPETTTYIKLAMQSTAQQLNETPNPLGGNQYGSGLIDAFNALRTYTLPTIKLLGGLNPPATYFPSQPVSLIASRPDTLRTAAASSLASANITVALATNPDVIIRTVPIDLSQLPSLPTGSGFNASVPLPATFNPQLGAGSYKITLNSSFTYNGWTVSDSESQFLTVVTQQQPSGLSMFSIPFVPNTTSTGVAPEQQVLGLSSGFSLQRYDPLNPLGTDDTGYFTYEPGTQLNSVIARFTNLLQSNDPLHDQTTVHDASLLPLSYALSNPPAYNFGIDNTKTSLAPIGVGFWLNLGESVVINTLGTPTTDSVGIPLFGVEDYQQKARAGATGWNMIGAPYPYPVNWSSVTVRQQSPIGTQSYSLTQAIDNNLISAPLVAFDNSTQNYVYFVAPAGQLLPFHAYWVNALQDCTIVLPPTSATLDTSSRSAAVAQTVSQLPKINGWRVRVGASVAGDTDVENYLGEAKGALEGEDKFDILKPPTTPSHVYARFLNTDRLGRKAGFAFDMRPNNSSRQAEVWTFAVGSTKGDANVTVNWDGLGTLPSRSQLTLKDTVTGTTIPMNSRSSYTYHNAEAGATRQFTLSLSTQNSAGPLQILNVRTVDVGGRGVTPGMSVQFSTTQDADVTATVKTLSGSVVNTLAGATRAVAQSGTVLRWNGRSSEGFTVAPGPYVLEITARTDSGETVTIKRPIAYLR